ncbi:MAG: hypothetical protein IBX55_23485, partial [Methyloprofundus sp.]|nr:hypothetical protein [Methyloprofundus sp.]
LRKILKDRIGLDSDALGKLVFSFDRKSLLNNNLEYFVDDIFGNDYFDSVSTKKIVERFTGLMRNEGRKSVIASKYNYILTVAAKWLSNSRYL